MLLKLIFTVKKNMTKGNYKKYGRDTVQIHDLYRSYLLYNTTQAFDYLSSDKKNSIIFSLIGGFASGLPAAAISCSLKYS